MKITEEILNRGKSSNNGWNLDQLRVLGLHGFQKGWKKSLIGKEISEEQLSKFINLKDTHFRNPLKIKAKNQLISGFTDVPRDLPYQDQYKHPNWQKMRLAVFKKDNFKCVNCGSANKMLHAHHLKYKKGCFVWEVPVWYLVALCEDCHSQEHGKNLTVNNPLNMVYEALSKHEELGASYSSVVTRNKALEGHKQVEYKGAIIPINWSEDPSYYSYTSNDISII